MNISEIKEKQKVMNDEISDIITKFAQLTGTALNRLDFTSYVEASRPHPYAYRITTEFITRPGE
jgi:hypothetical protein